MENLFGTMEGSKFSIREYEDFKNHRFKQENNILTRINGELTIINTIEIIKKYKPKFYIIENPAHGRIWEYIDKVLGFKIKCENLTYYNNYGFEIQKATKFGSNIFLDLKQERKKAEKVVKQVLGYNNRSNIPEPLIIDIFQKIINILEDDYIKIK